MEVSPINKKVRELKVCQNIVKLVKVERHSWTEDEELRRVGVTSQEDEATEAGGGNLHRGRGATAWGREEGGDDASEAGGATSPGDGGPLPGAEKKEATTRQRPAGATSTGDGEPLPGAEQKEPTTDRGRWGQPPQGT